MMTMTLQISGEQPPAFGALLKESRLVRAEAELVRLRLPRIARWRRNVRYAYAAGYLLALNAKCHHRPLLY